MLERNSIQSEAIRPSRSRTVVCRRLDANRFVKHGLPAATSGSGQYEIHTVKESVDLPEFANGCRLAAALALATLEA